MANKLLEFREQSGGVLYVRAEGADKWAAVKAEHVNTLAGLFLELQKRVSVGRQAGPAALTNESDGALVRALMAAWREIPHGDCPAYLIAHVKRAVRLSFWGMACGRDLESATRDGETDTTHCLTVGEARALAEWQGDWKDLSQALMVELVYGNMQALLQIATVYASNREVCACCGTVAQKQAMAGLARLKWWLCDECEGTRLGWDTEAMGGAAVYIDCPVHGENNRFRARYQRAIALFNQRWGKQKRGPQRDVQAIDWEAELASLRQEWIDLVSAEKGQANGGE